MTKKPSHEKFEQSIKELDKDEALRALLNATIESALLINMEGKILAMNQVAAQRLGKSVDELIGLSVDDYLSPNVAKFRKTIREEIARSGKPIRFRDEREGKIFDNNVFPVFDVDKKIIGIAVYAMDITEIKETEEALRRKDRGLIEAQRIAKLGNWNWNITTNELSWSDEVYRIFGLQPQVFAATYDAFLTSIHSDDRESVKEAVNKALSDPNEKYSIEHRVVRPDDSKRIVHEMGEVTFDENGNPIRMLGTVQDITERKRIEEALHESEERYTLAVAGSTDGLWDWDILSDTVYYSDRFKELLGYLPEEFPGTLNSFRNHLHPEHADVTWAALERHLKERVPYNVEYRLRMKSGEYRWFLARGQAIWDREERPIRMAGSISDMTARKQAEADINERLLFENMISELSTEFINLSADETNMKISFVLSRIGTFMNVDRCYLFRFNWKKTEFSISHLWEAEGVKKDETVRGVIVKDLFPWLSENLLKGKDIILFDVEELRILKAHSEYEYCRQMGIQSFLILPIQVANVPLCAIGLDSICDKRTWSGEVIDRLRIMGEVFANTIGRRHAEEELLTAYEEIKELKDQLETERDYLQEEIKLEHNHENIIGSSEPLKYVLYKLEQAATIDSTVLILGETGTGKELVARAIHRTGFRHQRSLVKVNCATLPINLIESELFGHEKGAFTGATAIKIGRFELADNTTLFLDEIGELPLELQAKMLRAIEDGEFERLGGSKTIKVNVRIIAATNRNLEKEMKEGRFREDLWYRLNVFPITMPPLRERKEDIPSLLSHFVDQYSRQLGKSIEKIPESVIHTLQGYSWPGNIRELKHVVERAVINSSGPTLRLADSFEKLPDITARDKDDLKPLAEIEREYIMQVLDRVGWKVEGKSGAAEVLDMNPGTLRSRMKKLGIRRHKGR